MADGEVSFTVHLKVILDGPEAEWDQVAELLRQRIDALGRLRGGFRVAGVTLDEATLEEPSE